jgi:hypothetical protein
MLIAVIPVDLLQSQVKTTRRPVSPVDHFDISEWGLGRKGIVEWR